MKRPRLIIKKDGTASLINIRYEDLRSILNGAAIASYDQLTRSDLSDQSKAYHKAKIKLIKLFDVPSWESPHQNTPVYTLKPHEIAWRKSEVKLKRNNRMNLDRILKSLLRNKP